MVNLDNLRSNLSLTYWFIHSLAFYLVCCNVFAGASNSRLISFSDASVCSIVFDRSSGLCRMYNIHLLGKISNENDIKCRLYQI